MEDNYLNVCFNNINLVTQCANRSVEALRVVEKEIDGETQQVIKKNGFFRELFLKATHALFGNVDEYKNTLKKVLDDNVESLKNEGRDIYVKEDEGVYTELFISAQRYNHACHSNEDDVPLFADLGLTTPIIPKECSELAPITLRTTEVAEEKLTIPGYLYPLVKKENKLGHNHTIYHYNARDVEISHAKEAINIFSSTQRERLMSLIGRIVEFVGKIFGKEITDFKDYHYFKKGEKIEDIYSKDVPIATSDQPTSYWIGHATCLISVPVKSDKGETLKVNILTDPVEGDLNKILYPRMTDPARPIDTCPVPHVFMLSHNHLDHFDKETLKKLKQQQPIMLIPEGDREKFLALGFKNIHEHNWWQQTTIEIEQNGQKAQLQITAVPAHHWSGQGPCDGHHAAFLGYVIHQDEGDIYFAGDTARLSEQHIKELREQFNIRSLFQPGGPDEVRKDMESTHQASVDGLWMHFNLMIRHLYDKDEYKTKKKSDFLIEAKKLRTLFMHTKTYKLGNLHFDDTDESVKRVKEALSKTPSGIDEEFDFSNVLDENVRSYEKQVYMELLKIGKNIEFEDGTHLEPEDILAILDEGVIIPKIGSRTNLSVA